MSIISVSKLNIAVILFLCMMASIAEAQQKRFAVLIGNSAYSQAVGPLPNPVKDVGRLEIAFRGAGFEVAKFENATKDVMLQAARDLAANLDRAGPLAVGVFLFSGHGVVLREQYSYLLPLGVVKGDQQDLEDNGVKLQQIYKELDKAPPEAAVYVVIDACRTEFKDTSGQLGSNGAPVRRGFAPVGDVKPGIGREPWYFVTSISTAPGDTAWDGDNRGSPYAIALAEELGKPQQPDLLMFNAMRSGVRERTPDTLQTPWLYDSLYVKDRPLFGRLP